MTYSDAELLQTINQARKAELIHENSHLANLSDDAAEHDYLISMGAVDVLMCEAVERGLARHELDYPAGM